MRDFILRRLLLLIPLMFGVSFLTTLPVTTEIDRRLPVTAEHLAMTVLLSLLLGIPPGVLSAIRPGTALDHLARVASVLWLSVPSYWLWLLALSIFLHRF